MARLNTLMHLPPDDLVMTADREVKPGEVFDRIVKGEYATDYQKG